MSTAESRAKARKIEKQIEIAASIDSVWKALTDPEELARWFPLEARVKPGEGGTMWLSWGPGCEGEANISVWVPKQHLQTKEAAPGAEEPSGGPSVAIDWFLESRGNKTLVRLVQSGFGAESDWQNEYFDSTDYGWGFMLVNLRHYLERHAGTPRLVAWPRKKVAVSREQAYERIAGANGLFPSGSPVRERPDAPYTGRTAWGESYSGRVEFVVAPRGFCVTVKELNDALLWLAIEGAPGQHEAQLWLSAYSVPQRQVDEFSKHGAELLERLFPEPGISAKSPK
jgi:uncharacterized protein YndB with AHSA1/START domain